jgi:hypothetical protein
MQARLIKKIVLFSLFFIFSLVLFYNFKPAPPPECLNKKASFERLICLKPYFESLTYKIDASNAVKEAQALQEDKVIDDCHLAAHFIGEANLRKNSNDAGKAFATCPSGCVEGCFHGVMESYVSVNDNKQAIGKLPLVCDGISRNSIQWRQCIHGVGHGLLGHNPDKLIPALTDCNVFNEHAKVCQGGVLMQNMNNYLLTDEKTLIKNLPFICSEVEEYAENMISNCYSAIGEGLMFYTGHNLNKSKQICTQLHRSYRKICIDAAEKQLSTNIKQI